jgi:hypothetical protein
VREADDGERLLCGLSYLVARLEEASQLGGRSLESMDEKMRRRRRGHYRHREIRRRKGRKTLYGSRAGLLVHHDEGRERMKGGVGTNGIPLPEEVLGCIIDPEYTYLPWFIVCRRY